MKGILLSLLLLSISSLAKENKPSKNPFLFDDRFPGGYFLIRDSLPHFMGIYMKKGGMHKIKPTPEQEDILEAKFMTMSKKIMKTAKEVKALETKVVLAVVYDGKTAEDLAKELDEIAKKKKYLTQLQIGSMNLFKKTLTKEQFDIMIQLTIENEKNRR